jgi:acetyl esterase
MFHKPCPGYEDHFYSQLREDSSRVKRAQEAQGKALMHFEKPEGMTIEDREIDSVEGDHKVHIRVYTPAGLPGKSPVILDIHGGAWVGGNLEIDNQRCAELAVRVPCVVVGVEYRLCTSPEVHFPMNFNDVYAAYTYCRDHAEEIGGNGMVGTHGSSSGANLAAGLALYLRDSNEPAPALTVLNCPPLSIDFNEDYSYHQNFELRMGPDAKAPGAENAHLGGYRDGLHGQMPSCYAFPSYAGDVGMLGPHMILVGEYDTLRDGGLKYAMRLLKAGVPCEIFQGGRVCHCWTCVPGHPYTNLTHDFIAMGFKREFGLLDELKKN